MASQLFESLTLPDVIGILGALLYLASYAAVQTRQLDGNGLRFTIANTVAALLVLIGLSRNFNIAAALIQITWLLIGGYRLFNVLTQKGGDTLRKHG